MKVTSKNSIFKNLAATLRAGSLLLPSLDLTQIFFTKAIFRGSLKRNSLIILLYVNLAASGSPQDSIVIEGAKVQGWLDNPAALVNFEYEYNLCASEVEVENISYTTLFDFIDIYFYPIDHYYGDYPPGLHFKSMIKDSTIYITEANICFIHEYSFKKFISQKIPLKIIFPWVDSDTIKADFLTKDIRLFSQNPTWDLAFLIRKGHVFYSYAAKDSSSEKFDREKYEHFKTNEAEWCGIRPGYECGTGTQNPKYIQLMNRLRPYYGKELWDIAQKIMSL